MSASRTSVCVHGCAQYCACLSMSQLMSEYGSCSLVSDPVSMNNTTAQQPHKSLLQLPFYAFECLSQSDGSWKALRERCLESAGSCSLLTSCHGAMLNVPVQGLCLSIGLRVYQGQNIKSHL
jgi:hypothetical protein